MEEDEMGWVCGTYGAKTNAYRIPVVNSKRKIHLEDLGIDEKAAPEEHRVRGGTKLSLA
jgi:hypothetical protein